MNKTPKSKAETEPLVQIKDLGSDTESYLARNVRNCRDKVDAEAFLLCVRFDEVITLGKVIATPYRFLS